MKTLLRLGVVAITMGIAIGSANAASNPKQGDELPVIKISWPEVDERTLLERAAAIAELSSAGKVATADLDSLVEDTAELTRWSTPFHKAPELQVKLIPEYNEVRLINTALLDQTDSDDIGESAAIEQAIRYLDEMIARGIVTEAEYNLDHMQLGYTKIGGGAIDKNGKPAGEPTEQIVDYRVTFRPNIKGVQLANAGVRLAIHRSGKLSAARVGGVIAEPTGDSVDWSVSSRELQKRLDQFGPRTDKKVDWARVMYVMPEDQRSAIVEPLHTVAFSAVFGSEQGEVISRKKVVGFSIADPDADPLDFTAPGKAKPDGRERK